MGQVGALKGVLNGYLQSMKQRLLEQGDAQATRARQTALGSVQAAAETDTAPPRCRFVPFLLHSVEPMLYFPLTLR
jgi:hypothetical protein